VCTLFAVLLLCLLTDLIALFFHFQESWIQRGWAQASSTVTLRCGSFVLLVVLSRRARRSAAASGRAVTYTFNVNRPEHKSFSADFKPLFCCNVSV